MPLLNWNQRFFESTRGKIIMLLRRASRTVEELAQALNLTDNAVRTHLVILERGGLVRQQGVRHGAGKPAFVYELAPETEQLFPKHTGPCCADSCKSSKSVFHPMKWKRCCA
jgi:predicted ArsR family transcriptional regulator